jgi:hypothetical protein
LQELYYNINTLMSDDGGGGSSLGSSYVDSSVDLGAIHNMVDVLPVLSNPPLVSITWT